MAADNVLRLEPASAELEPALLAADVRQLLAPERHFGVVALRVDLARAERTEERAYDHLVLAPVGRYRRHGVTLWPMCTEN